MVCTYYNVDHSILHNNILRPELDLIVEMINIVYPMELFAFDRVIMVSQIKIQELICKLSPEMV